MVFVIGITGLPGSGKGEFVNRARELARERNLQFHYYSLSDVLRDEAKKRGDVVDRETLNRIGNELRGKVGSGALSLAILPPLIRDIEEASNEANIFVIDSIRTPEEVDVFRKQFDGDFHLVAITADAASLISRVQARARYDESKKAMKTPAGAEELLERELGKNQPSHGLNISGAIASADFRLNNTGTLDQFREEVTRFLNEWLPQDAKTT